MKENTSPAAIRRLLEQKQIYQTTVIGFILTLASPEFGAMYSDWRIYFYVSPSYIAPHMHKPIEQWTTDKRRYPAYYRQFNLANVPHTYQQCFYRQERNSQSGLGFDLLFPLVSGFRGPDPASDSCYAQYIEKLYQSNQTQFALLRQQAIKFAEDAYLESINTEEQQQTESQSCIIL